MPGSFANAQDDYSRHSELVSESLTVADCNSREVALVGKTNIDRSQSTRQTGSHNSQACWFALSNEFGMTQSGDDNGCNVIKDNDMTNNKRIHHDNRKEDKVLKVRERSFDMKHKSTTGSTSAYFVNFSDGSYCNNYGSKDELSSGVLCPQ